MTEILAYFILKFLEARATGEAPPEPPVENRTAIPDQPARRSGPTYAAICNSLLLSRFHHRFLESVLSPQ
jgi:hypothetical protein